MTKEFFFFYPPYSVTFKGWFSLFFFPLCYKMTISTLTQPIGKLSLLPHLRYIRYVYLVNQKCSTDLLISFNERCDHCNALRVQMDHMLLPSFITILSIDTIANTIIINSPILTQARRHINTPVLSCFCEKM